MWNPFSFLWGTKTEPYSTYGNIVDVETGGASWLTSQQDKLSCTGVKASRKMAETDARRMDAYKDDILSVAQEFDVHPAIIAAIISRESRAGNTLTDGYGDWDPVRKEYNAYGLMQVDINPKGGNHKKRGKWNSKTHIRHGTEILVHFIKLIQVQFKDWTKEQQLKGGIAAYNVGNEKIFSYNRVDEHTTGGDYSNDVVARAKWYEEKYF